MVRDRIRVKVRDRIWVKVRELNYLRSINPLVLLIFNSIKGLGTSGV